MRPRPILVNCDHCRKEIKRNRSNLKQYNYCDKTCRTESKRITQPCVACGKPVTRLKCAVVGEMCCNSECSRLHLSRKMSNMNADLNPTRMRQETKAKLREAHLGKGEGKAYTKIHGRHTHRIVAEQLLGRPLNPGEVVHHINENKLDNRPENIMVFASQADHARWHTETNYLLYGTAICNTSRKHTS